MAASIQLRDRSRSNVAPFQDPKAKAVCEALRAAMPGYDAIMATLIAKGGWWKSFRQKLQAVSSMPNERLPDFAAFAYTSQNPAVLAILTMAYARSAQDGHDIYALVDTLVISDFAYAATKEGMECLVLLAKSYNDMGQPRRSWLTYRKGITIGQLMVRRSWTS